MCIEVIEVCRCISWGKVDSQSSITLLVKWTKAGSEIEILRFESRCRYYPRHPVIGTPHVTHFQKKNRLKTVFIHPKDVKLEKFRIGRSFRMMEYRGRFPTWSVDSLKWTECSLKSTECSLKRTERRKCANSQWGIILQLRRPFGLLYDKVIPFGN